MMYMNIFRFPSKWEASTGFVNATSRLLVLVSIIFSFLQILASSNQLILHQMHNSAATHLNASR